MQALNNFAAYLTNATTVVGVIVLFFWKADTLISASGRQIIYDHIMQTVQEPNNSDMQKAIENFMGVYFSPLLPARKFVFNTFIFTIISMIILLCIYLASIKVNIFGFLVPSQESKLFWSQFFANGLVVTFLVNYTAFSLHHFLIKRMRQLKPVTCFALILLDAFAKLVLFVLITALIYVGFAALAGSFGGSVSTALRTVIPTIRSALEFTNLTGVYIYSVAISSLPLFLVFIISVLASSKVLSAFVKNLLFWLPLENQPIRIVSIVLALFMGIFYAVSTELLSFTET